MQVYSVLFLAGAVLLASADAASTSKTIDIGLQKLNRSLSGVQDNVAEKRYLRTVATSTEEDEESLRLQERAINFKSILGIEKLSNMFSRGVTLQKLLQWNKKGKPVDYVFKRLELDKAGARLFDNPDLNVWVAYSRMLHQKDPDGAIVTFLTTRYGEAALSKMILAAKDGDKTKKLATELQNAQLKNWLRTKTTSTDVHRLLNVKGSTPDSAERALYRKYLLDYNEMYIHVPRSI